MNHHPFSNMHNKNICFISQILSIVADQKDLTYNKSWFKNTLIMMGITIMFTNFVPLQLE